MDDSGLLPAVGDDELAWLRRRQLPAGADREEVSSVEVESTTTAATS
ncbi:MAG: hypothetical protein QOD83_3071 [Solirubrobacteraceae bacterium]|jgi:hypothetical protein|nr:hypothetical protein [Solirubrobacteraceae bacterium]